MYICGMSYKKTSQYDLVKNSCHVKDLSSIPPKRHLESMVVRGMDPERPAQWCLRIVSKK
jgi:hypothetical protein